MPLFHLHVHNSHGDAEDDEGFELSSLAIAREKAVEGISGTTPSTGNFSSPYGRHVG